MENKYDLIIIGGGPAGITAGIYAARQKIKSLLITKVFGGQMAQKSVLVENYTGLPKISGADLIKKFEEHLRSVEIDIETDAGGVKNVEKTKNGFLVLMNNGKEIEGRTVIIASGAEPRSLDAKGIKDFIGRGVSYCPMCDGPIFRDKIVAVIGGGNAGFEAALFLANYVKKIYLLNCSEKTNADMENQQAVEKQPNIEIINNAETKEIKGDKFVKALIYKDKKSNEEKELKVDGVFVEIGYKPVTDFAKDLVDLNEKGEIEVDASTGKTKTLGLYAAGDVDGGKCKQIIVAAGEGANAAVSAYKFLQTL